MKFIKKLSEEEFVKEHPSGSKILDALRNPNNAYYCNTCDGLRVKGHTCYCYLCKRTMPDSDKHENCPVLEKYHGEG